jgi:acetyl-CoA C-acetyltransferase
MSVIDSRGNRIAKSEKEVSVMRQPVIISATRTAIGKFQGALKSFTAPQLGSIAVRAAVERAELEASRIDEVIMGCALQAGLGQNPARAAPRRARRPPKV